MTTTPADIEAAAGALRAGELVAFPTETVYGLGADARNPDALRKVYALKGRPATHPLILHLASAGELGDWVESVPAAAQRLAARFWPGPLTLVLRRAPGVSDVLTGGQDTVAVRVPAHPVAQALLAAFGSGIAAPSANRYGRVSPTRAEHVRDEFPQGLRVLDGGGCEVGLESTILSLVGAEPQLLRPGSISRAALEAELGVSVTAAAAGSAPRVPGSTPQHYAPSTPLQIVPAGTLAAAIEAARSRGEAVAVLPCPPGTAAADYGRSLYCQLRSLDKQGASRILAEAVPASSEWDAVRDRLARAAATFL
ncbi:MAG: threonylcarbamoyl-AMP synthase [Gammaproteobacteria bacterium]|nr:threonylcarbamoyl-AMP synthase [Gammaproteobacteria bacterium]